MILKYKPAKVQGDRPVGFGGSNAPKENAGGAINLSRRAPSLIYSYRRTNARQNRAMHREVTLAMANLSIIVTDPNHARTKEMTTTA